MQGGDAPGFHSTLNRYRYSVESVMDRSLTPLRVIGIIGSVDRGTFDAPEKSPQIALIVPAYVSKDGQACLARNGQASGLEVCLEYGV